MILTVRITCVDKVVVVIPLGENEAERSKINRTRVFALTDGKWLKYKNVKLSGFHLSRYRHTANIFKQYSLDITSLA